MKNTTLMLGCLALGVLGLAACGGPCEDGTICDDGDESVEVNRLTQALSNDAPTPALVQPECVDENDDCSYQKCRSYCKVCIPECTHYVPDGFIDIGELLRKLGLL